MPASIIQRIGNKVMGNSFGGQSSSHRSSFKFISAPYIRGASERTEKLLKKYDVKLSHKPTRTLSSELCRVKDVRKNHDKAGVVYKIACKSGDAFYVGETGRQVKDRMIEHIKDIEKHKPLSKVYDHVNSTGHEFDFENVSVLDTAPNIKVRKHLESIYTALEPLSINRSITMDSNYNVAIDKLRNN